MNLAVRFAVSIVLASVMGTAGCDRTGSRGAAVKPSRRVLLIGRAPSDPTWRIVQRLMIAVPPVSPDVEWVVQLPPAGTPGAQQDAIEQATEQKFDAICVWVIDPTAVRGLLEGVYSRGTPVVALGKDVGESGRALYCGPDETDIGAAMAEACGAALNGPARTIGIIHAASAQPGAAQRLASFKQHLAAAGGAEVLREIDYGERELEAGQLLAAEVLRYPRMGGWVLLDAAPLNGWPADRAVVPPGTALVFYTPTSAGLERVRLDAKCSAVCPDFESMFSRGMWTAGELARQSKFQSDIETIRPLIVTRSNIDTLERTWFAATTGPAAKR